jgi:CDGSH-type Zn-finger protein
MSEAIPAQKAPYPVDVEAGQKYAWCACGRSSTQPFCDGAHKAVGMRPTVFNADESKKVFLCGCKATGNVPFCDGKHKSL